MSRCGQQHVKSIIVEKHFYLKNSSIGVQILYSTTFLIFLVAMSTFGFTLKMLNLKKSELVALNKHQFWTKRSIWMNFFLIC